MLPDLTFSPFEQNSRSAISPAGSEHIRPAGNNSDPLLGIRISTVKMRHMLDCNEMQTRRHWSLILHPITQIGYPDAIDVDVKVRWITNIRRPEYDQLGIRLRTLWRSTASSTGRVDCERAGDRCDQ